VRVKGRPTQHYCPECVERLGISGATHDQE
jgi:hypothetical protein